MARYQQQKKQDKSRASTKGGQLKELVLKTVKIGVHDLMIKINHAREFLKEGNKVQFTLRFKGREMAHVDLGRDLFVKIKTELYAVSKIERDAKMEGRRMTLVLQPEIKDPNAKPPKPGGTSPKPAGVAPRPAPLSAGAGLNIPNRAPAEPTAPAPARPAAPAPARPAAPVTQAS